MDERLVQLQDFLLKNDKEIVSSLKSILYLYGISLTLVDSEESYRVRLEVRSHGICNELELDKLSVGLFLLRIVSFAYKNKGQNLPSENQIEVANESYAGAFVYMIKRNFFDEFDYPENIGHELNSNKKNIISKFYNDIFAQIKKQNFYSDLNPNDYFVSVIDLDITYKLFERC